MQEESKGGRERERTTDIQREKERTDRERENRETDKERESVCVIRESVGRERERE